MDTSPKLTYEQVVQRNIEENKRVLKSLGLYSSSDVPTPKEVKLIKPRKSNSAKPVVRHQHQLSIRTRRSSTLILNETGSNETSYTNGEEENTSPNKNKIIREPSFGEIEGVSVGDWWMTRLECSAAGVHRPTVAGIHGKVGEGCYSIALSGGYEDDLDCGDYFTYTGSGGRDLKGTKSNPKNLRTAPQSKDQVLEGSNAALASNIESKIPVRVIRGYKLQSPYAPEEGYRYDGLYSVEKQWIAQGHSGYKVIKFALKRLLDQAPAPWKSCSVTNHADLGCLNITDEASSSEEAKVPVEESAISEESSSLNNIDCPASHGDDADEEQSVDLSSESPKKQMSILNYFSPVKTVAENLSQKNIVNPKSLRSNRYVSLSAILPTDNQSKTNSDNTLSKINNLEENSNGNVETNVRISSSQKRKYSSFCNMDKKMDSYRLNPKASKLSKPAEMLETLLNKNKKHKLERQNMLTKHDNKEPSSPVKPCVIKLQRIDDGFLGWDYDDFDKFYGFDEEQKNLIESKLDPNDSFSGWASSKAHSTKSHEDLVTIRRLIDDLSKTDP